MENDVVNRFYGQEVEYRFGCAWNRGKIVGTWIGGDQEYIVVEPDKSTDVLDCMPMTDGWRKAITWLRYSFREDTERFVLTSPDRIRGLVEKTDTIGPQPHKCPKCGCEAIVMFSTIECSNFGCKYYKRPS